MRSIHVVFLSLVSGFAGGALGGVAADRFLPLLDSGEAVEQPVAEEDAAKKEPAPPPRDPSLGSLQLDTVPWAVVFLGGEELGDTPLEVDLPGGVHRLRFLPKRSGKEIFREVEVKAGKTTRVELTLLEEAETRPQAPPPPSKEPPPLNPPPPPSKVPTVVR
jgi:hypothetical protein